jgi:hypothetical protein
VIFDRLRGRARWTGTSGTPPSGNGASSFHLSWVVDPPLAGRRWVVAEAVFEVLVAPAVPALSFWALQASFDDRGRHGGAGHLGLQWHSGHPGSTAVNWGGYGPDGVELHGSTSSLPSAMNNVNTRDFAWAPGERYRLRIAAGDTAGAPSGLNAWRGEVTDLTDGRTTVVRELWAGGTSLTAPVMWSEVFARCDDPPATVRWSELRLVDDLGAPLEVDRVRVNYQSLSDGGCANTDSAVDEVGFVQVTNTSRRTPQGSVLQRSRS